MTTRKSWMVEMPASAPAKATRSGKPIAPAAKKKKAAPVAPPAPKAQPRDERERGDIERRERTQGSGHGRASLNPDGMRARLVERLRTSGIRHPAVLAAMGRVPRHRFVDEGLASRAYDDTALPIGHAQTISQPYVVARMTELIITDLPIDPRRARVLEVGTGCGYQAAVLAEIFGEVYTIERIRALHDRARDNLRALRVPNLRLVYGDGHVGVPDAAPFDAMILAAAGDRLPEPLLEQLAIGGRVIAPVAMGRGAQTLVLAVRTDRSNWSTTLLDPVRFVPLRDGLA